MISTVRLSVFQHVVETLLVVDNGPARPPATEKCVLGQLAGQLFLRHADWARRLEGRTPLQSLEAIYFQLRPLILPVACLTWAMVG